MLRPRRSVIPIAVLAMAATLALAACGGSSDDNGDKIVHTPVNAPYLPIVISSDLALGQNRFVMGLIKQDDQTAVVDAKLHMRFFFLQGSQGTLKFEADATAIKVTRSFTDIHADGTVEVHQAGDTGAYDTQANFDTAGDWGVEVTGTVAGAELEAVRPTFTVNQKSVSLSPGDPAPRSVQPLLKDVADIREIDTSEKPILEMHQMTIADAVTSGRPTVIVFATPAFCTSQICGPTKTIVDDLYGKYSARANFVHVEPYDVKRVRNNDCPSLFDCRSPVMDEWKLQTEPWVFLVDKSGNIAGKYEGIVSEDELEAALKPLLG